MHTLVSLVIITDDLSPVPPSTAGIVEEEVILVGNHYKFTLATDINYWIIIRGEEAEKWGKKKTATGGDL